jgi:hypothetical protein
LNSNDLNYDRIRVRVRQADKRFLEYLVGYRQIYDVFFLYIPENVYVIIYEFLDEDNLE